MSEAEICGVAPPPRALDFAMIEDLASSLPRISIFFFVPAVLIDNALDRMNQEGRLPVRAIVVSSESRLLKALDTLWGESVELTIVLTAASIGVASEGALLILEQEQIGLDSAVWISDTPINPPCEARSLIATQGRPIGEWVSELLTLM